MCPNKKIELTTKAGPIFSVNSNCSAAFVSAHFFWLGLKGALNA